MSPEKSKELISIYPKLFDPDNDRNLVVMFGFECGNGWFDLLKECIGSIKEELETNPWNTDEFGCNPRITQIKEKYGILRFYMDSENDAISAIIRTAEDKSEVTCENCGHEGSLRCDNHWYFTRCDACESKRK